MEDSLADNIENVKQILLRSSFIVNGYKVVKTSRFQFVSFEQNVLVYLLAAAELPTPPLSKAITQLQKPKN